uniref:N-terminal methionine N(alpha)-acetyltransferase NatC n=1 Tax=Stomoxys calcitrans TaxID=35570 RepID=A0A1I8P3P9_STOCA
MEQIKGSSSSSSTVVAESTQHHQQQQQQQSKKKSKNKKKTSRNEMTSNVASGASDEQTHVGSVDAVNGLKDQLKQQLQIGSPSTSSSNNVKVNGLVNENDTKMYACTNNTPPAASLAVAENTKSLCCEGDGDGDDSSHPTTILNGHHKHVEEGTTGKKSKRKPNNKKNPPSESIGLTKQENGHCAMAPHQEDLHLHNGFVPANKDTITVESTQLQQQPIAKAQNVEIKVEEKTCNTAMTKTKPSDDEQQTTTKTDDADDKGSSESNATAEAGANASSTVLDLSNVHIEYKEYESELQMHDIMRLIQAELSEPYSIYTYRYFIYNWPKLCFLAAHGNEYVGAIVCKLDMHMNVRRGYIAMLAVRKEYRKLKIGTTLVQKAIEAMLADKADEVVLETEMSNLPALRLYENLGFVRDKRLFRYYLNGVDALRLKLWFR